MSFINQLLFLGLLALLLLLSGVWAPVQAWTALQEPDLSLGHDLQIVLNRQDRVMDLRGDLRFFFLSIAQRKATCQDVKGASAFFGDLEEGTYRIRHDGEVLFRVTLGQRILSATGDHVEYRER